MEQENWRVKRLEEEQKKQGERMDKQDNRIDSLEKFQYATIEKLKTIFERLKEIEKTNKWVSQSFFYLILSGAIGVGFFFFQWLITSR